MNKLLHKLTLQALFQTLNGSDPDHDVNRMYIPNEFARQYARLIVQECITELADAYDMTTEQGNHLKHHFGLE